MKLILEDLALITLMELIRGFLSGFELVSQFLLQVKINKRFSIDGKIFSKQEY